MCVHVYMHVYVYVHVCKSVLDTGGHMPVHVYVHRQMNTTNLSSPVHLPRFRNVTGLKCSDYSSLCALLQRNAQYVLHEASRTQTDPDHGHEGTLHTATGTQGPLCDAC